MATKPEIMVITGDFVTMSREEMREALQQLGYKVRDTVTYKCTACLIGANPGIKAEQARALALPVRNDELVPVLREMVLANRLRRLRALQAPGRALSVIRELVEAFPDGPAPDTLERMRAEWWPQLEALARMTQ